MRSVGLAKALAVSTDMILERYSSSMTQHKRRTAFAFAPISFKANYPLPMYILVV